MFDEMFEKEFDFPPYDISSNINVRPLNWQSAFELSPEVAGALDHRRAALRISKDLTIAEVAAANKAKGVVVKAQFKASLDLYTLPRREKRDRELQAVDVQENSNIAVLKELADATKKALLLTPNSAERLRKLEDNANRRDAAVAKAKTMFKDLRKKIKDECKVDVDKLVLEFKVRHGNDLVNDAINAEQEEE